MHNLGGGASGSSNSAGSGGSSDSGSFIGTWWHESQETLLEIKAGGTFAMYVGRNKDVLMYTGTYEVKDGGAVLTVHDNPDFGDFELGTATVRAGDKLYLSNVGAEFVRI